MRIAVLFGGKGSRMGEPKWSLEVLGIPLWQLMRDRFAEIAGEIFMVVPEGTPELQGVIQVTGGKGYLRDLVLALKLKDPDQEMVIINGDAVLVNPEEVDFFCELARRSRASICIPMIPADFLPEHFRNPRVTNFMPGSMNGVARPQIFYFSAGFQLSPECRFSQRLEVHEFLATIGLVGWENLGRILAFCSNDESWERRWSQMFSASVDIINCHLSGLAIDVDTSEDMRIAEQILQARQVS